MKKLLLIGLIILLFCSTFVAADCVEPTDEMTITEDTTFCLGTYNLPNGIEIGADNVILDCNGAVLVGDITQNVGIRVYGNYNNIKNCKVTSYQQGFLITGNHNQITLSEIYKNMYGMALYGRYNLINYDKIVDSIYRDLNMAGPLSEGYNTIEYNEIGGSDHAIYLYNSGYNNITLNTITSILKIDASVANNVTTVGNRIWDNDFYEYGVIAYNDGNLDDNIFCVDGIGNNYYDGASGPTCPDEDNDGAPDDEDLCPDTTDEKPKEPIIYGCSCKQILDLKPGKDKEELKNGCSEGSIKAFTKLTGWAKNLFG